MSLNPICEQILQYIIDNSDEQMIIMPNKIYQSFPCPQKTIVSALNEIAQEGCIRLSVAYDGEILYIKLTNNGMFYFANKSQNSSVLHCPQTITINNSTGVNIGNNNTVNIANGMTFEDVHRLIDKLNTENNTLLHEIIDTLQDCFENSKPLPKGKFEKFSEFLQKCTPFTQLLGQVIAAYLSAKGN